MQNTKYDAVAMALHWLIGIPMIVMFFFGEELMQGGAGTFLPSLHVSLGVTILLRSVLRLVWRLMNPPPPYPPI